ncbi:MAG: hypothetical protein WD824_12855 [Cyclobacteriaceae bacterium]
MKKALFISWDKKKEDQAIADMALTKEQRIEKMFELIDLSLAISRYKFLKPVYNDDHFIVLKKKNASFPKRNS